MPHADERRALIAEMRSFNRFYTRTIGLLEETLTASPFTLTEARVLFELGHRTDRLGAGITGEAGFLADLPSRMSARRRRRSPANCVSIRPTSRASSGNSPPPA